MNIAGEKAVKLKVLAYVTRVRDGVVELLVHEHRDAPEAGIQVPAGSVEEGENLEAAVLRELREETGITAAAIAGRIEVYDWFNDVTRRWNRRNVYHLRCGVTDERWTHRVGGDGEDEGMAFDCWWMPIGEAERRLVGDQGRSLGKILKG